MSVFRGGCDLAAVEAVCGDDGFGVVPALEMLIQASLIREHEGVDGRSRYGMLRRSGSMPRGGCERVERQKCCEVVTPSTSERLHSPLMTG